MFLQRLRYQLSLINAYHAHNHDYHIFDDVATTRYSERINSMLGIIQDFFENPNIDHFKKYSLPTIIRIYNEILDYNGKYQNELSKDITLTNERLLYPCFPHNKSEDISNIESIHIGLAFSQNHEIYAFIKELINRKPIPLIFLYVEGQALNVISDFIMMNSTYRKERRIIIRTVFNGTMIEYVDNIENTTKNEKENDILLRTDNEYRQRMAREIGITIQNLINAKTISE